MENKNIELDLFVGVSVTLTFTNTTGTCGSILLDDIAGVRTNKNGVTIIDYYTGNPDCETDLFYVKESEEEVRKIIADAERMVEDAIEKYEIKLKE